jgi:hypothetical protein
MSTEPVPALEVPSPSHKTARSMVHSRGWSDGWFYFCYAWLIAAIVAYGFAQTISENLLHATTPRPRLLWVHATVFSSWIGLFILQTTLVRSKRVRWHRRLGAATLLLGSTMPFIGTAIALVMARFEVAHSFDDAVDAAAFLSIPFNDMIFFSGVLAAAYWWRKRPDMHRRLMLIATCLLTAAAFARFPFITIQAMRWYAGVDALILVGIGHDLLVHRRMHPAYAFTLPPVLVGQVVAMWLFFARPLWWIEFANRLIG